MKTKLIPAFLVVLFAAVVLFSPQAALCAQDKTAQPAQPAMKAGAEKPAAGAAAEAVSGPVNINTATAEELAKLPGVGPKTAEEIVKYRKEHGAFKATKDIMNVKGIGDKKFKALEPKITVGTP
ncbi:MAG: helix-hairpin-helix domain-containing protein [Syntrophobacteraceae bacterium]|jgi:competence protein ComEA|nr:helix-hairpin-helix domain-containing protein [Syntrophobacteraceae bacterium]